MVLSDWSLVCGCYVVLKFNFVLIASCNLPKNINVNRESTFDTIEIGTPCNLTISHTYIFASLSMESVILMGRKWMLFVSLSTITHMISCSLGSLGGPMTKSIAI
jgi:hypothetical protein